MRTLATLRFAVPFGVLVLAGLSVAAHAQTWTPQTSGTPEVLADVHFINASTGFAVGDGGLLLSTTNSGETWTSRVLNAGLDNQGIAFNPSGTVGVIITDAGPVLRTTDGGVTWTQIATGMSDGRAAIDWASDTVVWVAGRDANAAVSTDGGLTWTFRNTGSSDRTEGLAAVSAQEAWVVNRSGEIRHTTNGGVSWTTQPSGTSNDLKDIQMLDALTGYIAAGDAGVLKTTNGGTTWTNVGPGAPGNGLFFLNATTGWIVCDFGQIRFTNNGGTSWVQQPSGVTASFNRVHFPDATHGWAVGDAGTIVKFTGQTTANEGEGAPTTFALEPAYPNPFNPTTTLRFTLDAGGPVRLVAYDALGREVARLADGTMRAGAHTVTFDAAGLPSGLYLVRLTAGAASRTQAVTLAR